jgi:hypothetical protein
MSYNFASVYLDIELVSEHDRYVRRTAGSRWWTGMKGAYEWDVICGWSVARDAT